MGLLSRLKGSGRQVLTDKAESQFELAVRHGDGGRGVYDYETEQLLRMSWNIGLTEPQFLGAIIDASRHDVPAANKWYLAAAGKGNAAAMFNLGFSYEHGIGVEADLKEAIRWYTQAANCEMGEAAFFLGCLYASRKEVRNLDEAYEWLNRAVTNGFHRAGVVLYVLYCSGLGLDGPNTYLASKAIRSAAEERDPLAMYVMADLSLFGSGYVDKNLDRAWKMMEDSAIAGCHSAMTSLGVMYAFGFGGRPKDGGVARELLKAAADRGDGCAMNALGMLFLMDGSSEKTVTEGCALIKRASEAGNPAAMNNIVCLRECGFFPEKNIGDVDKVLESAYKAGSNKAHNNAENIAKGGPLEFEITCGSINIGIALDTEALARVCGGGH